MRRGESCLPSPWSLSGILLAAMRESQPPRQVPTKTTGPSVSLSMTPMVFSTQVVKVNLTGSPTDLPVHSLSKTTQGKLFISQYLRGWWGFITDF